MTRRVLTVNQRLNLIYETRHERTRPWDGPDAQGVNLRLKWRQRSAMEAMPSPTNLPWLAWSRYPSAGMSHLHELLGRPIIFHRYTPKKTETRGISVALLPPPRHTICITDISRARDLYVLRTTSSSNLKLTDLPAGHKLTHECDDNYSSWYIYTSVCVYICAYAGCDNGESLLSWQEELREGRGNECLERLHAPRSITPKCCFVPYNKHLAILFVMEEGFFFFLFLISRIEKWKF